MKTIHINFDIATPSLNKLNGRWAKLNWKKKFLSRLKNYEYLAPKKKCLSRLEITRYGSRILDKDNYHGGVKSLMDSIKEKGLIVDDSPKWCDIIFNEQVKCKRNQEKTEVEISYL